MPNDSNDPGRFWENLRSLVNEVNRDDRARDLFLENPGRFIQERHLDIGVPVEMVENADTIPLSEMLDNFARNEREAVLDAFSSVSSMRLGADIGRVAIAVPISSSVPEAGHLTMAGSS